MNCINCNKETDNPKFCSRSCAVSYNNTSSPKRILFDRICLKCGKNCGKLKTKTCSDFVCTQCLDKKNTVLRWLEGSWNGGSHKLSTTIRKYLLSEAENRCSRCGFSGFHPSDGRTILEINHIDGNGQNHRPENLEVLCPNCHAMTASYRGRNVGNGRPVYYIRTYK